MYKINVETYFSAAHHLKNYSGNCENIHGHNWKVRVTACYAELQPDGIAIDFRDLKKVTQSVIDELDHQDLNQLNCFENKNSTSENIAKYIFDAIKTQDIPIKSVTVFETDKFSATYSE